MINKTGIWGFKGAKNRWLHTEQSRQSLPLHFFFFVCVELVSEASERREDCLFKFNQYLHWLFVSLIYEFCCRNEDLKLWFVEADVCCFRIGFLYLFTVLILCLKMCVWHCGSMNLWYGPSCMCDTVIHSVICEVFLFLFLYYFSGFFFKSCFIF